MIRNTNHANLIAVDKRPVWHSVSDPINEVRVSWVWLEEISMGGELDFGLKTGPIFASQ